MTLLEKAQSIATKLGTKQDNRIKYDRDELLDLAIAYGNREITSTQIRAALELGQKTNVQSVMANAVMGAFRQGRLEVKKR